MDISETPLTTLNSVSKSTSKGSQLHSFIFHDIWNNGKNKSSHLVLQESGEECEPELMTSGTNKQGEVWAEAMLCDHENSLQMENLRCSLRYRSLSTEEENMEINKGAFEKKRRKHMSTGLAAKQAQIGKCCLYFPALLRKLLCILRKVDWKDIGNFVHEIILNGNRPRQ